MLPFGGINKYSGEDIMWMLRMSESVEAAWGEGRRIKPDCLWSEKTEHDMSSQPRCQSKRTQRLLRKISAPPLIQYDIYNNIYCIYYERKKKLRGMGF